MCALFYDDLDGVRVIIFPPQPSNIWGLFKNLAFQSMISKGTSNLKSSYATSNDTNALHMTVIFRHAKKPPRQR